MRPIRCSSTAGFHGRSRLTHALAARSGAGEGADRVPGEARNDGAGSGWHRRAGAEPSVDDGKDVLADAERATDEISTAAARAKRFERGEEYP